MTERIDQEVGLLKKYYPTLEVSADKMWILIPNYQLPTNMGWNKEVIPVAAQFPNGFPGAAPYGIYVPSDLLINEEVPTNFEKKANQIPPFSGEWGIFSWSPETWRPTADVLTGSNMAIFARSFLDRFKEGK
jgi:hypothetical protein